MYGDACTASGNQCGTKENTFLVCENLKCVHNSAAVCKGEEKCAETQKCFINDNGAGRSCQDLKLKAYGDNCEKDVAN